MVEELPTGQHQPDQENTEPKFITIPEQRLLTAVFGETKLPIQPIHPRRRQELIQTTREVLDSVLDRERRAVKMRFGLEDGKQRSLAEVGREFGVTGERIRQIEAKALRKLRHPSRSKRLYQYIALPADSVASSIANLNDEGYSLVNEDLTPLSEVSLSELGGASPLVEYIRWQTESNWKDVRHLVREDAKPFFDYLSDDRITILRDSLTQVYEKAQAGFYQKPEEPEPEPTTPEETLQRLIYPNLLFPDLQIPLEGLAAIGSIPIEALGLSVRPSNALRRHWPGRYKPLPTIAELLSQTKGELLHRRDFGKASLEELEERFRRFLTKRFWGEGKTAEEIIREIVVLLPEVPAGKYPLEDNEKFTTYRYNTQLILTKSIVSLADSSKVSFLGFSVSGKAEDKEKVVQEFIQTLGEPNANVPSTDPEGVDFLSWPL